MPLKSYQEKMLELMSLQEIKLAELYQVLARSCGQLRNFWIEIHGEELEHAQWVEHLANKAKTGGVQFQEDSVRTYTVQSFIDFIDSVIAKTKGKTISVPDALAIAADMEASFLERKVFEHFRGGDPEVLATFEKLRVETEMHYKRVLEMKKQYNDRK